MYRKTLQSSQLEQHKDMRGLRVAFGYAPMERGKALKDR